MVQHFSECPGLHSRVNFLAKCLLIVHPTMRDVNNEYISQDNSPAKRLAPFDTTNTEEGGRKVSPHLLAGNKNYVESQKCTQLPDSLRSVKKCISLLSTKLLGHDIDKNLSIHIILATLELQKNYLEKKQKLPVAKRRGLSRPKVSERVCKYFHISPNTYSNILCTYLAKSKVYLMGEANKGRSGNDLAKVSRLP